MSKARSVWMAFVMSLSPVVAAAECDSHAARHQPVVIAAPSVSGDRLSLNVQVKQELTTGKRPPTRGVVELRSPSSGETIKIGTFSVFPSGEGEGTQNYRFDVSSQAASLKSLGPSLEVAVVAVDAITGEPTSDNPYEVLGAKFQTVN
ncbi:hypothetical protein ACWTU6_11505 [Mesorhizobium sp. BHbsci]